MVADHNKLQNDWVDMTSKNGLNFKGGMGKNHRKKLDQLQKAIRKRFRSGLYDPYDPKPQGLRGLFQERGSRLPIQHGFRERVAADLPVVGASTGVWPSKWEFKVGANPNAVSSKVSY